MRRLLLLLVLAAAPAYGANETYIQPDETFTWQCEFPAVLTSIASHTVKVMTGSADANAASLVTGMQVDPGNTRRALWTFTPAGRTVNNTYHVHVVGEDAAGSRFACDGSIKVKKVVP